MATPPSSSFSSQSQFACSKPSYFPVPFHLQQTATTHYAAPYVAAPLVQIPAPPVVCPVAPAPVPAVYSAVPQYQALQLFEGDAQIITPEAIENVKSAIASSDVEQKTDAKKESGSSQSCRSILGGSYPCRVAGSYDEVVRDKRTGKTKGYGFVSFANPADLAAVLKEMNGKYVGNRPIKLRKSKWKERIDYDALEKQKVAIFVAIFFINNLKLFS